MLRIQQSISKYIRQFSRGRFIPALVAVLGALVITVTLTLNVAKANAQAPASCAGGDQTYQVAQNDTLSGIAARLGTSWQALASHNHLANPSMIQVGQPLCVSALSTHSVVTLAAARANVPGDSSVTATINQVFGAYGSAAVRVATCESGLNPNAQNPSGASGLFQILPSTWAGTSQAGQSEFNPTANILAAHEIFARDGNSWREWVCQP